jgi:hypothetical protein
VGLHTYASVPLSEVAQLPGFLEILAGRLDFLLIHSLFRESSIWDFWKTSEFLESYQSFNPASEIQLFNQLQLKANHIVGSFRMFIVC